MFEKIAILIADDQEIIRHGIHFHLDKQPDFQVIGETDSGEDAIAMTTQYLPDIVLLDIKLSFADDARVIRQIKKSCPNTQVVVLTSHVGDERSFQALKAGAISYLGKDIKMADLTDALRDAAKGNATLHPNVAARLLRHIRGETGASFRSADKLSSRELEVLKLVAGGLTNFQIATKLEIRESTVKGHIGNIRNKLKIVNRIRLALYAWEQGIIHNEVFACDPLFTAENRTNKFSTVLEL